MVLFYLIDKKKYINQIKKKSDCDNIKNLFFQKRPMI